MEPIMKKDPYRRTPRVRLLEERFEEDEEEFQWRLDAVRSGLDNVIPTS
jgi:hypothetical protein